MAIHFIPIGIEANSKDEAEQKLLQIQQIVADYKGDENPNEKNQKTESSSLGKDVFRAIMQIGLLWVTHRTQRTEEPTEKFSAMSSYERERYKRKKQQERAELASKKLV